MVAFGLGDLDITESALHHGRRTGKAMLLDQLALQAARIDADAHRQSLRLRLADDLPVPIVAADVAGIDADLVDRVIESGQGHLVIEVDVANQRNVDPATDFPKHSRV